MNLVHLLLLVTTSLAENGPRSGHAARTPADPWTDVEFPQYEYNELGMRPALVKGDTPTVDGADIPVNDSWYFQDKRSPPHASDMHFRHGTLCAQVAAGALHPVKSWQCATFNGVRPGTWTCAASVIGPRYLLTAAHCLFSPTLKQRVQPSAIKVFCGLHNKFDFTHKNVQTKRVIRTVSHDKYKPWRYDFDAALLQLDSPLTMNDYVKPICLPSEDIADYKNCVVTGWGDTRNTGDTSVLRQVVVPIVPRPVCKEEYAKKGHDISENMICAGFKQGGKDACFGDSGGPLQCKMNNGFWQLQGIVSWGDDCAQPSFPGVYTRVTRFLSWIQRNTGKNHGGQRVKPPRKQRKTR